MYAIPSTITVCQRVRALDLEDIVAKHHVGPYTADVDAITRILDEKE